MEIRQIQYFVQICKDKSILKASKNLYVSQQALSKAIQNLEKELATELFTRSKSGMTLTTAGTIFLGKAAHILTELDTLSQELDNIRKEDAGEKVSFCFTVNTLKSLYLEIIWAFQDICKNTSISFIETNDTRCAQMVFAEQVAFACVSGVGSADPAFFDYVLLQQQAPWLAISEHNPLTEKDSIKMADLARENFLLGSNEFSHYHEQMEVCLKLGYCPRTDYLSDDIHTLIDMVALNKGIYILPEFKIREMKRPGIKFYPLEDTTPVKYYLITKKGRDLSPTVKAFRDFLIENQEKFMAKL